MQTVNVGGQFMVVSKGRQYSRPLILSALVLVASAAGSRPVQAHSNDWAAPFMGGLMAGRVLSRIEQQKREQTEAMQEMARGGGGGLGAGYGREQAPPQQYSYAPPQLTPEQKLQQLDDLAAGGYITPQQYKERRQAILNSL
jgi:hypothetical protein